VDNTIEKNEDEIVYRRAILILSHRDHSVEELKRKLTRRDFSQEAIRTTLEKLSGSGLLDDSRFSEAYVREKVRSKPMGRKRLFLELTKRGISEDVAWSAIGNVMNEEEVDEEDLARAIRMKRLSEEPGKLAGVLRRRGFGEHVIRKVLEEG
jgi:regulatory protein